MGTALNSLSLSSFVFVLLLVIVNPAIGDDSIIEYAEHQPLASQAVLLDALKVNSHWVAVGERGHVVLSSNGTDWEQAEVVPTRSTLVAISGSGNRLWAVGHDAVIITSADMGETWTRQHYDTQMFPILDVLFVNEQKGFAVGAYGQLLVTDDGGENWEFQDLNETVTAELFADEQEAAEEDDYAAQFADLGCYEFKECHLNAIVSLGGNRLMMLAEKGFGYRSVDGGESWEVFRLPYEGSMFGAITTGNRCVLTFGLRGNVFESCDFGDSWEQLVVDTESSLLAGYSQRGETILVGNSGVVLERAGSDDFSVSYHSNGVDLSGVETLGKRGFMLVGEDGIHYYPENEEGAAE